MSALREQMRRAREAWFDHGAHGFLIRRPTVEQLRAWRDDTWSEMLGRCVVSWRGVRVCDLVPGGTVGEAEFEPEALVEWLADTPELMGALADEMQRRIAAHAATKDDAEKN
jgi:predicted NAD/FAD-dependent oxidoreductase